MIYVINIKDQQTTHISLKLVWHKNYGMLFNFALQAAGADFRISFTTSFRVRPKKHNDLSSY